MAHKFTISAAASDQFKFAFEYNSEKIFWSEAYKQKASAKSAIESLKSNAPGAITVDLSSDETGSGYRFEASIDISRKAYDLTYAPAEAVLDDKFVVTVSAVAMPEP